MDHGQHQLPQKPWTLTESLTKKAFRMSQDTADNYYGCAVNVLAELRRGRFDRDETATDKSRNLSRVGFALDELIKNDNSKELVELLGYLKDQKILKDINSSRLETLSCYFQSIQTEIYVKTHQKLDFEQKRLNEINKGIMIITQHSSVDTHRGLIEKTKPEKYQTAEVVEWTPLINAVRNHIEGKNYKDN